MTTTSPPPPKLDLSTRLTATGLLAVVGLSVGWTAGCWLIRAHGAWPFHLLDPHAWLPEVALDLAAGMALAGHWMLHTTPAWLGLVTDAAAIAGALVGTVIGWTAKGRKRAALRRALERREGAANAAVGLVGFIGLLARMVVYLIMAFVAVLAVFT